MIDASKIVFVPIPPGFQGKIYMHHNFDLVIFEGAGTKYLDGKFDLLGTYDELSPELKLIYDKHTKVLPGEKKYIALRRITDEEFWELLGKLQDEGTPSPQIINI